jgi:hypothetical protein
MIQGGPAYAKAMEESRAGIDILVRGGVDYSSLSFWIIIGTTSKRSPTMP